MFAKIFSELQPGNVKEISQKQGWAKAGCFHV